MPTPSRPVVALLGALAVALLGACGGPPSSLDDGGKDGATVTLAAKTCWTATRLGTDPQVILALSKSYDVNYFDAAHALAGRPAFKLTEACGAPHHIEVYRTVAVNLVKPLVTNYAVLLQPATPAYQRVETAVERACMNKTLARTADLTGLPGAIAEPTFPEGVALGWAPPSPDQWARGQRVYACTLISEHAVRYQYASVFARSFPIGKRTCIDSAKLTYVDCTRKHDRERIALIDLRAAVNAGQFVGRTAIRTGPDGRYLDVAAPALAVLDKACTSYLKAISTTKKYTGIAEIDADQWPTPDGAYPVACEADVAPTKKSVTTKGSVYNRK